MGIRIEVEGFEEVLDTLSLAVSLKEIGRLDIVKKQFSDSLCYDGFVESVYNLIDSLFAECFVSYDEDKETSTWVFEDSIISDYYCRAYVYCRENKIQPAANLFVQRADDMIRRSLNFSYNLDWKVLGYSRSLRAAKKSKLIVYIYESEFCEHYQFVDGLIQIYKWFSDQVGIEEQGAVKREKKP